MKFLPLVLRNLLRRKVRTLAGNFQILGLEPRLLAPWRNPVWFQYVSHKICRLLVPYALLAAFFSSLALAQHSVFYLSMVAGEVAFLALALQALGVRAVTANVHQLGLTHDLASSPASMLRLRAVLALGSLERRACGAVGRAAIGDRHGGDSQHDGERRE